MLLSLLQPGLMCSPIFFAKSFILSFTYVLGRVSEVVRGHGGPLPKSLDPGENFKLEHTLLCREDLSRFMHFLEITVFLGQEVHYYIVYIAYFTELKSTNLQLHAKNVAEQCASRDVVYSKLIQN